MTKKALSDRKGLRVATMGLRITMALSKPYEAMKVRRDPCDAVEVSFGSPDEMDLV